MESETFADFICCDFEYLTLNYPLIINAKSYPTVGIQQTTSSFLILSQPV